MLNFPISDDLRNAFSKAKGQSSVRYVKMAIKDEKVELDGTGTAGTLSLDFNGLQKSLNPDQPCFIAFRYKDTFATAPWALIMFTPDSSTVQDKMMYASSFAPTRDALGGKFFSKLKSYSALSEFVWNNFYNSESDELDEGTSGQPKVTDSNKPWNKRELAVQQLEKEDAQALKDFESMAAEKPKEASGFHQVSFPLTPAAIEAIKNLEAGPHNWAQLTLDEPPTKIDIVKIVTISPGELSDSVVPSLPQFYLYNKNSVIVLIFCSPDNIDSGNYSQTIRSRMVYSTCKAGLADSLKSLGVTVKKFDIREPSELTTANLEAHMQRKVAGLFKGSDLKAAPATRVLKGGNVAGKFDQTQFRGNSPVFNRPGFNQPTVQSSSVSKQHKEGSLAGLMANTGTGSKGKTLPKGVVIPPSGAYS